MPSRTRTWLYVSLFALVVLGAVAAFTLLPDAPLVGGGDRPSPASPQGAQVEHARWRVDVYPAGATNPVTKDDLAMIERQGATIVTAVREIYDAVLLQPDRAPEVVNRWFAPDAAAAFLKIDLLARGAQATPRLTKRVARVGVQAQTGATAAVAVTIRGVATLESTEDRALHRAALYLEHREGGWRVVAFDIDQRPLAAPKQDDGGKKRDARSGRERHRDQRGTGKAKGERR